MSTTVRNTFAPREISTKPRPSDRLFRAILNVMSYSSLLILTLIGAFLIFRGFETFREQGFKFITGFEWTSNVVDGVEKGTFGIGAMIIGTLLIAFTAIAIGVPISAMTALYLNFYAPVKTKALLTTILDLMAAFPSILFGLWGYFVLAPMAEYWA